MKNIPADITIYKNLIRGKLLNRRVELIKIKENETVMFGFTRLVQIKEGGYEDFISSPTQILISRPHSNYGTLSTVLKVSPECVVLMSHMLEDIGEIICYKFKPKEI